MVDIRNISLVHRYADNYLIMKYCSTKLYDNDIGDSQLDIIYDE